MKIRFCPVALLLLLSILAGITADCRAAVDPHFVEQLFLPDGTSMEIGHVSIAGNTAAVGVPMDNDNGNGAGAVYIFTRTGTAWILEQKLLAPDGDADDRFGGSLSLNQDRVVIGSYWDDDNGVHLGSAYIFIRNGTVWSLEQKLLAPDGEEGDIFGGSVSLNQDRVVIGAYWDADNGNWSGSAYVFIRTGTTWGLEQKLLAPDGAVDDFFGLSVSLDQDRVVIGAIGDDDNGDWSGSAYVFSHNGTTWGLEQKLLAPNGAAGDNFGLPVSLSQGRVIIGAYRDDDNGTDSGSAYVFIRSGTVWSVEQKLLAPDGAAGDSFGSSVFMDQDRVVIGSSGGYDNGTRSGSVYVFSRSNSNWSLEQKLLEPNGQPENLFGTEVALSGETAMILSIRGVYIFGPACGYDGRNLPANTWQMHGPPCVPNPNDLNSQIGDDLPGAYDVNWVSFLRDPALDDYVKQSSKDAFIPGQGHWLYSTDPGTVTLTNGDPAPLEDCEVLYGFTGKECLAIDLVMPPSGTATRYNLVGHPFPYPVDWAEARIAVREAGVWSLYTPSQAEENSYAGKTIFIWNGSVYQSFDDVTPGMNGVLQPQESFWVYVLDPANHSAEAVKLLFPAQ